MGTSIRKVGTLGLSTVGFAAASLLFASMGMGQNTPAPASAQPEASKTVIPRTGNAKKNTLLRMQKPISAELNDTKLEEVFAYIVRETGADLEVLWKTDNEDGYDKEQTISISVKNLPALDVVEKIFEKLEGGMTKNSWQMNENGPMQVGLKKRLNMFKRVELYDINDLLFILPIYDNAPQIDLQQVLQSSGSKGGGSSQSPFKERNQQQRDANMKKTKEERATDLKNLITSTIETEQWLDGGGDGGTITYYQEAFVVNAADYMHRALNGYRWWPSFKSSATSSGVKRYVSLTPDTQIAKADVPLRTLPAGGAVGGNGTTRPPGGR